MNLKNNRWRAKRRNENIFFKKNHDAIVQDNLLRKKRNGNSQCENPDGEQNVNFSNIFKSEGRTWSKKGVVFSGFMTIRCMTHKHSSLIKRTNKIALFRIALEMVQWIFRYIFILNMKATTTKNWKYKIFLWHYMTINIILLWLSILCM